jgi:hypothetical protein
MLESLKHWLGFNKPDTTRNLLAVILFCLCLLFLPEPVLKVLSLNELLPYYRPIVGMALLGSSCVLIITVPYALWRKGRMERYKQNKAREDQALAKKILVELTPEEQAYLIVYIDDRKVTESQTIDDGIVGELVSKNILFRSTEVVDRFYYTQFNMTSWARSVLAENPELLDGGRTWKENKNQTSNKR